MNRFTSRKFLLAVAALILLVVKSLVPELEDMNTIELMGIVAGYLIGEGAVDAARVWGTLE